MYASVIYQVCLNAIFLHLIYSISGNMSKNYMNWAQSQIIVTEGYILFAETETGVTVDTVVIRKCKGIV